LAVIFNIFKQDHTLKLEVGTKVFIKDVVQFYSQHFAT